MSSSPEAVVAAYFDALNHSDAEALSALFDENGVFMGGPMPTATGREEIQALSEGAFDAMDVDHTFEVDSIDQRDGVALVQTHSWGTVTMKAAGTTIENAHRELFALRDGADGWRITYYMFNTEEGAGEQSDGAPIDSTLLIKSLDQPDEVRPVADKGKVELVVLGDVTVGRATFEPGWRWSEHVKPIAGTDLCEMTHVGYVLSGRQAVQMSDGTEHQVGPGEAFVVGPGHDGWVVGDEPCVTLDFNGMPSFAKQQ